MVTPVPQQLSPFLMFQGGRAQEAIDLYTSLFDDGEVLALEHWSGAESGREAGKGATVKWATLQLAGEQVQVSDSPIEHPFGFTPSLSLFLRCGTEEELERIFAGLAEGGQVLMPLDSYDFSERFGWVADRFGVTWQISLQASETSD